MDRAQEFNAGQLVRVRVVSRSGTGQLADQVIVGRLQGPVAIPIGHAEAFVGNRPDEQLSGSGAELLLDSRSSKKMRRTDRERETTRIGGQSRSCNLWGGHPASQLVLVPDSGASARYRVVGKIGKTRSPAATKSELLRLVAMTDLLT